MKRHAPGKKPNFMWTIFSSVKLALILLIIIAITSIAGTLIPQREEAMELARRLSPGLVQLFRSLQLFDMYHSTWFRIIFGALALNLIVCSINRFPATLRLFKALPRPDRSRPFENLPSHRTFSPKGEFEQIADRVTEILKGRLKNLKRKNTERGVFIYGEKGRYSYFGVYLVHLSVFIILIGALIGSGLGFDAYVNIAEGKTIDSVRLRKTSLSKKLGFSVHCKKFTVEFYDNGAPKEYRSELDFISNGHIALKKTLLVNHPITFRGITFYQSSYGVIPGNKIRLKISKKGDDSAGSILDIESGKLTSLPGDEVKFLVEDIRGDFMRLGPAALIALKPREGEEIRFWVFQHQESIRKRIPGIFEKFSKLNPASYKPYSFFLERIETKYYTGLQVNKDPGVSFVWLGCFMMVTGFFITFFTSHRRIWLRILINKGKIEISVAGRANKNPVGLEKDLDRLTHKLSIKL